MQGILNEILTSLVYPAIIAAAGAGVKFVLEWSKIKAREALIAAAERSAAAISLQLKGSSFENEAVMFAAKEMAEAAEAVLRHNFAETLKKIGPVQPGTLSSMVLGELGKLQNKQGA
jgi:hypothetical protein